MNSVNTATLTETDDNEVVESSTSGGNPSKSLPPDEVNNLVNWNASLRMNLDRLERAIILAALHNAHGNRARAARALGITERIMGLRVRKYRINARAIRTVGYDTESEHTVR